MRPYGLPRFSWLEYPDIGDIHFFGLKSSTGSIKKHGENIRGIHKNKDSKRATRRYWKRHERAKGKKEIREETNDFFHHRYCECEVCYPPSLFDFFFP